MNEETAIRLIGEDEDLAFAYENAPEAVIGKGLWRLGPTFHLQTGTQGMSIEAVRLG